MLHTVCRSYFTVTRTVSAIFPKLATMECGPVLRSSIARLVDHPHAAAPDFVQEIVSDRNRCEARRRREAGGGLIVVLSHDRESIRGCVTLRTL